jgi:hypothetical protein
MWWLWLACHVPSETGPTGMVAVLSDAAGAPVVGADVTTLEEHLFTDADGRFAIQYKSPEQYVDIQVGARPIDTSGAPSRTVTPQFRRSYLPEDDGKVLDLRLPVRRDVRFACAPGVACADPHLAWDLGGGLTATADPGCGVPIVLAGVPDKTPVLTCGTGAGVVRPSTDLWMVEAPPREVRVDIRGEEGRDPVSCAVMVGAAPVAGPPFVASVSGSAAVSAICDGRPALPKVLRDASSVTLDWSATGPSLDLSRLNLGPAPLTLVMEGEQGFVLTVPPDPSGRYPLPPLPAGNYRMTNGEPAQIALIRPPTDVTPDVVRVLGVDASVFTATLSLSIGLEDGTLPVSP